MSELARLLRPSGQWLQTVESGTGPAMENQQGNAVIQPDSVISYSTPVVHPDMAFAGLHPIPIPATWVPQSGQHPLGWMRFSTI